MHLLMLSAFRQFFFVVGVMSVIVSMHLLALSAFRLADEWASVEAPSRSQCTFWCSVLSDLRLCRSYTARSCLNAPSGAQCFPTGRVLILTAAVWKSQCTFWCSVLSDLDAWRAGAPLDIPVSMHLLVLSAFRLDMARPSFLVLERSQCTFWCSMLSDDTHAAFNFIAAILSQCTFWCSVLSDPRTALSVGLLSKSQCTFWCSVLSDTKRKGETLMKISRLVVSMHLLVLSAFRRGCGGGLELCVHYPSQCTFWCSVLSDRTAR